LLQLLLNNARPIAIRQLKGWRQLVDGWVSFAVILLGQRGRQSSASPRFLYTDTRWQAALAR
jgi:hypothetical protein